MPCLWIPAAEFGSSRLRPARLATLRDNALWFTDQHRGPGPWTSNIGRITPAGQIRFFSLPTPEIQADDIALGADGDMWFTAGGSNRQRPGSASGSEIGQIAPNGRAREFAIDGEPNEIVRGSHNEMLFTSFTATGNRIGRVTTGGKVSEIQLPSPNSCFVPRLVGQILRGAEQRLRRASCGLGKITRLTGGTRKLVVVRQHPSPDTTLPSGFKIAIQLG